MLVAMTLAMTAPGGRVAMVNPRVRAAGDSAAVLKTVRAMKAGE